MEHGPFCDCLGCSKADEETALREQPALSGEPKCRCPKGVCLLHPGQKTCGMRESQPPAQAEKCPTCNAWLGSYWPAENGYHLSRNGERPAIKCQPQPAAQPTAREDERVQQIIEDRHYWEELCAYLPWKLYGFTGRNSATYTTRTGTIQLSCDERDDIHAAHATPTDAQRIAELEAMARLDQAEIADLRRQLRDCQEKLGRKG